MFGFVILIISVILIVSLIIKANVGTGYITHSDQHDWDPLDPTDPYNDCPDCGSGDTDGNHCYDCDEDF